MAIPDNLLSATTEKIDPNTSGWAPLLNCTLSLGSGGRNGDGCLVITSSAAGEMQARTASSYPVSSGELYYTFADAAGGTVPERIGIRWLTSTGAEIGIAWSLVTTPASSGWHRVSVAGYAPAGTTRAQVVVGSTPAAVGVTTFVENAYLGAPIRTQGNLFSFAVESSELDGSGWEPEVNAAVTRQAVAAQWPVDWYYGGGHVIAITASAAGNAAAECTERASVEPGAEYVAYAYLVPPTLAAVTWIELRFYDRQGNRIDSSRGRLDAYSSSAWQRQRASAIAPPTAATCSIAIGLDGASAGQRVLVETVVVTIAPHVRSGNLLTYTSSSFEQDTGGWEVADGAGEIARSTPWGTGYSGSYSLAATTAAAGETVLRSPVVAAPGAGGLSWRTELFMQATSGTWQYAQALRWLDAGGEHISTSVTDPVDVEAGAGIWQWAWYQIAAPEGAEQVQVELALAAVEPGTILLDQVAIWQDEPLLSVVVHDEDAYISLTLRELPVGGLLTVYRVGTDGARTLVRGPSGLYDRTPITADLLVIEDYEAPLGVPVSYRIEMRSAATGAVTEVRTTGGTYTIDPGDPNYSWLKDPANPQRNMRLLVKEAPEWQQPITQEEYRVRGRPNAVIHSDVRSGAEGDLVCWTQTDDQREALKLLLSSGNVLLWQSSPDMGEPDVYVNVGEISRPRVVPHARVQWREWTLPLVEADMPLAAGINGTSGRTWQDGLTENATWDDGQEKYATWEDLFLNRRR